MSKSVIVVGAGAAGLSCAARLASKGLSVTLLEARDRPGGRIFTQHIPGFPTPIELGAEFVHGRPPAIFDLAKAAGQEIIRTRGDQWCGEEDGLKACAFFDKVEELLEKMRGYASPDRSFSEFLEQLPREQGDENVRSHALQYISGFNAADPAKISVRSLIKDMDRTNELGGDEAHRLREGYSALISWLRQQGSQDGVQFHMEHVVEKITYSADRVLVCGRRHNEKFEFESDAAVVTVPVSLLRPENSSSIRFEPALPESKLAALRGTILGPVVRLVLIFHQPFWKDLKGSDGRSLAEMRFLFSQDRHFPTWWTQQPVESPMLVAWAAGPHAEQFHGRSKDGIVEEALTSLGSVLRVSVAELKHLLRDAFFHDWQADPFSLGAYTYLSVGPADAPEELARPIADKLFFAGEATDVRGDHATVHGAIASGHRAAEQVLSVLR